MPGGRAFAADPIVAAPGELPSEWVTELVGCVIDQSVGLPDSATLTYHDPRHEFLGATGITIGTPVTVSVETVLEEGRERLFTGEVTALELDSDGTGSYTVVRAYSGAHRLFRGRRVVAFRNMTAEAIIRQVATTAGLACGRIEVPAVTYPQRSQANVSDWEFLRDLAEEVGANLRVDDNGRLEVLTPRPASSAPAPTTSFEQNALVLEFGQNLRSLRAALTGADLPDNVEVRGWNVTAKKPLVVRRPSVRSSTVLTGLAPATVGQAFGDNTVLTFAGTPYGTGAEATVAARSAAASVSAGFGEIEAVVDGNPSLRAGLPVALGNVGTQFSGRYTATAVRHSLDPQRGYRTTVQVSAVADRSIAGQTGPGATRAPASRMPGLAIGVVTDVREPGGAGRGWVKLMFPWLSDDYVTDWVRTVQWGGVGGGGVFSPEVNDEVLVGFEHGSLDRPYVLGGLYNGVDRPSPHDVPLIDRTSGKVNRRSLVSRSGNRVELLDTTTGPSGVRLATGDKRLEIQVDERRQRITISVLAPGGGRSLSSVTLTDSGIVIDAGTGDLVLRGRSVSVDGTADVQIDGGPLAVLKAALVRIN